MTYKELALEILSWPIERQLDMVTVFDSKEDEMYLAFIATNEGEFDQIDIGHAYIWRIE